MTKHITRILGLLLVVGLLFAALPTGQAEAQTPTGYELVTREGGTAAISPEQFHSGPSSVKFTTGEVVDNSDVGMIRFTFPDGFTLDDLTALNYWEYVDARESSLDVFMDIWLDYDNDGLATTADYPAYMQAEPLYTWGSAATLDTWTYVNGMAMKWSVGVTVDDPYNGPTIGELQANTADTKWTGGVDFGSLDILRIDIRVGYGYPTWKNFIGYADDITINGYVENFTPDEVWVDDTWAGTEIGTIVDGHTFGLDAFASIQAGIDAVAAGGVVNVFPGTYSETAADRTIGTSTALYTFGLFFDADKPGITLQGVKADGSVITSAADVAAHITTNSTANFGPDGVFVEADNITITGLEFLDNYASGSIWNNKTIEVTGNNLTFKYNILASTEGGSLYFNDWNATATTSSLQAYTVDGNLFKYGASLDICSGAGIDGLASGRVITNNTFSADGATVTWASISFNGSGTPVGWFTYTVGGATISGNTFTGVPMPIRTRGTVEEADFDWMSYFNNNNFGNKVIVLDPDGAPRKATYTFGSTTFDNVILIGTSIQGAIDHATAGDTVVVGAGTYQEALLINKAITLLGPNAAINPNTGTRVPEAIVQGTTLSGLSQFVNIEASDVVIKGFKFDNLRIDNYNNSTHEPITGDVIENNDFVNISGTAIYLRDGRDAPGTYSMGVSVSNNKIGPLTSAGSVDYNAGTGILLFGAEAAVVNNNVIPFAPYNGIQLARSNGVTLSGNVATGALQPALQIAQWNDGVNTISGNTFSTLSTTKAAVRLYGFTDNFLPHFNFTGNTIKDSKYAIQIGHGDPGKGYNDIRDADYSFSGNTFTNISSYRLIVYLATAATTGEMEEMDALFAQVYGVGNKAAAITTADPFTYIVATCTVDCYVAVTGSDQNPGTETSPFLTIQQAVNTVNVGGTIHVAPGVYPLSSTITINKSLTLRGPQAGVDPRPFISSTREAGSANEAIIDGNGTVARLVYVKANDVKINGFEFKRGTGDMLYSDSPTTARTYLGYNIIHDATGDEGIQLRNVDVALVEYNYVFNIFGDGINLAGSTNSNIENNELTATNTPSDTNAAIYVYNDGSPAMNIVIKGNYVHNVHYHGISLGDIGGADQANTGGSILYNLVKNTGGEGIRIGTSNSTVSGNNVSGSGQWGVYVARSPNGVDITNNTIYANTQGGIGIGYNEYGSDHKPTGVTVFHNSITNNTGPELVVTANVIDEVEAKLNWWGSACGPAGGEVIGLANIIPWYTDSAMTKTSDVASTYDFVAGTATAEINATIACAANGSTFTFETGNHYGAIVVPALKEHLTLVLKDGARINANSPCFTVSANYTTIQAESVGGAACIPSADSNGIDITSSVTTDVTITGLEFIGDAGTDGIHFAGPLANMVLTDNWIHSFKGDAIEFVGAPSGIIDIQGNLFQDNDGLGINSVSPIDVEFNSWGNEGGVNGALNLVPGKLFAGDGASTDAVTDPFTHADLYLVPSVSPWSYQVAKGQTVTFAVKGHLVNVNVVEFELVYPANLTFVSTTLGGTFPGSEVVTHTLGTRTLYFRGNVLSTNLTGDKTFYTVTFTANAVGTGLLDFKDDTDAFGMKGYESSSNVYGAALLDSTINVVELPVITSTYPNAYYLTTEPQTFTVTVTNSDLLGTYADSELLLTIPSGLALTLDGPYTLAGNLVDLSELAAGETVTLTFTATFSSVVTDPLVITLYDVAVEPDALLNTYSSTATVYLKPAITSDDIDGPYQQGIPQDFTLNVNNMSLMASPVTTVLHFNFPEGTVLVYGSDTYTCGTTGCDVPVTLDTGANPLPFTVTFDEAWIGETVQVALTDTNINRPLANASFGINVYANIASVVGTISMEGRAYRGGAKMTLTGTFGYGPYTATSVNQISNNLTYANLAGGVFTVTTNQPRYLNVTTALGKTIDINSKQVINILRLKGGNAVWIDDNLIDVNDASMVGDMYGDTGSISLTINHGDVNFDNIVNVLDLALVGGNFDLQSYAPGAVVVGGVTLSPAYLTWVP